MSIANNRNNREPKRRPVRRQTSEQGYPWPAREHADPRRPDVDGGARTGAATATSARAAAGIAATFHPAAGTLTVDGDPADNSITISRDAAGTILVNGGAILIDGGTPTVANTTLIEVNGQAGNDRLTLDEANGALPAAHLSGGPGDDILTGGSGAEKLDGGPGNDSLLGKGGADTLDGGPGDDILTGGTSDDIVTGGSGNDRLIWNPGDGSDLND
ncbi:MAG TPA: hypothetical protein VFD32_17260, partial [Dehalococcoidia bacterium]|nr:hypothetical protein [Dehalococcoidia bacterium]